VKTQSIPVAALAAGVYYFECTIHTDMNGTLYLR